MRLSECDTEPPDFYNNPAAFVTALLKWCNKQEGWQITFFTGAVYIGYPHTYESVKIEYGDIQAAFVNAVAQALGIKEEK